MSSVIFPSQSGLIFETKSRLCFEVVVSKLSYQSNILARQVEVKQRIKIGKTDEEKENIHSIPRTPE